MIPITTLAINTGMRKWDVLDLEKSQVFLDEQYIKLIETKNGEGRDVPEPPELRELLGDPCRIRQHMFSLIPSQENRTVPPARVSQMP